MDKRSDLVAGCFDRIRFLEMALDGDSGAPIGDIWARLYKRLLECNWDWTEQQVDEFRKALSNE